MSWHLDRYVMSRACYDGRDIARSVMDCIGMKRKPPRAHNARCSVGAQVVRFLHATPNKNGQATVNYEMAQGAIWSPNADRGADFLLLTQGHRYADWDKVYTARYTTVSQDKRCTILLCESGMMSV